MSQLPLFPLCKTTLEFREEARPDDLEFFHRSGICSCINCARLTGRWADARLWTRSLQLWFICWSAVASSVNIIQHLNLLSMTKCKQRLEAYKLCSRCKRLSVNSCVVTRLLMSGKHCTLFVLSRASPKICPSHSVNSWRYFRFYP